MTRSYTDIAETVGRIIAEAMLERETEWESAESPDRKVFGLLMSCGLVAMRLVLEALGQRFETEAKARGFSGERRSVVGWSTLFGVVEVVSVYMRKEGGTAGYRPMKDRLGVVGRGKTRAVERALTDFGIDESFGAAAAKFEEHYGVSVHRTTVRRTVFRIAERAAAFIDGKLSSPAPDDEEPHQVLVQADGANAPKVVLERVPGEVTRTGRPKYKKTCTWREVRLGFAVPDGSDSPTYVAQVGEIERFAGTLALAARHRRAADATHTYAVTDGGNGLRERLEQAIELDQYILDKRHCRTHLLDTATKMGVPDPDAQAREWLDELAEGDVDGVIAHLDRYRTITDAPGAERARQLRNHLTRFKDAVHYDDFVDRGMVVGSGEVESGHRHVTQRRLKISGAWWAEQNIDPIVALRCVRANGWWDEFCREAA